MDYPETHTNANYSAHAFRANWFCSEENSSTGRERGYMKNICSFAMCSGKLRTFRLDYTAC